MDVVKGFYYIAKHILILYIDTSLNQQLHVIGQQPCSLLSSTVHHREEIVEEMTFVSSFFFCCYPQTNGTVQERLRCLQQYLLKGWLLSNLYLALAGKALKLMTLETSSTFYGGSKHLLSQYLLIKKRRKWPDSYLCEVWIHWNTRNALFGLFLYIYIFFFYALYYD